MTRDEIQHKAVEEWLNFNKKGTLELSTGTGKTIASLHCLYTMPKNEDTHLFLAETISREADLNADILLYNKLFNVNVLKDYNLIFKCYQSVWKLKNYTFGLIIADEIHDSLSEQYSKFYFNNNYKAIVGLSATVNRNTSYEINGEYILKGELLDQIAPVCFTYTLAQAKEDGIGRKLNIYVIYQELNDTDKTVLAGSKTVKFYQTEKKSYDYWNNVYRKSMFILDPIVKNIKVVSAISRRSKLLFSLTSKITTTKRILEFINGKTIVFGNDIDSLLSVTPNVVSSRNDVSQNKKIRDDFEQNWIQVIGSFKKLQQGANLKELDNCILMSYYSTEGKILQMLGRLRKNGEKDGNVFILLTKETQEVLWFNKMMENIVEEFNIIYCENVEDCYQKYKINESSKF